MVGHDIKEDEAIDSRNLLDTWMGKSKQGRKELVVEGYSLGIRKANWKFIAPMKNASNYDWIESDKGIESGHMETNQLG
ncbi:hypothetical protein [Ancylomarina longa]|uniref:Uncharacterized protein n=1 Tax=Ancylomarina longa TaxID=2487017 RepID=A0A434AWU7_9BACT|nr:hypothetical protein [Ancylomarina longa]RUT79000.1 hypothetical protein DLK05_05840 [Ancylomarina longa]